MVRSFQGGNCCNPFVFAWEGNMRTRILLRFGIVFIGTIGLMLIWLAFLPRLGQATPLTSAAQPAGVQVPDGVLYGRGDPGGIMHGQGDPAPAPIPTPDPRWVELVRARALQGNAPSAQSLTINLNLTDSFISGRAPTAAQVVITIKSQDQVVNNMPVMPVFDGIGFFYLGYIDWYKPGSDVWVTQGTAVISMTVPTLTVLAYPQTDVLSGTAPANADLAGYLFPFDKPGQVYTATTIVSGGGTYQMDWSPIDLRPRDSGYLLYAQDALRQTYIRFAAPFLRVQVGGSEISGSSTPSESFRVYVIVENATGTRLGNFYTYGNPDGSFNLTSCDQSGPDSCLIFSPSDRVIAIAGGQIFSTTVVTVTARANRQAGQVMGQAPASQPVEVELFHGPLVWMDWYPWRGTPLEQVVVTATAEGEYAAALPLVAGNYGVALVTTHEGNQCYARYTVPILQAYLGEQPSYIYDWARISGQVEDPNAPITVEVLGPSGYLKDWYLLASDERGFFIDRGTEADLTLESGDRITLTTPHEPLITLHLPVLTAVADAATDIVSGQAPPFAPVIIELFSGLQMTVTANAAGQYSANFGGLGGFTDYERGSVTWTSPDGYTATRYFQAPLVETNVCPPNLSSAQVGGNAIYIQGSQCGPLTLRLRSADGQIKYEHVYPSNPWGINLEDAAGRPVLILPGDQIEIEPGRLVTSYATPSSVAAPAGYLAGSLRSETNASGSIVIVVVPTLTVNLDPQTDRVFGQAPPLAEIYFGDDNQTPLLTTTASIQGTYLIDLRGIVDLDAGSYAPVSLRSTPGFYAWGTIPVLNTLLYSREVSGRLQPVSPYTITLSSPLTVSAPITGYASPTGQYPNGPYPPPVGYHGNPGDQVQMETPGRFWEMLIPFLTTHVNAPAGIISGQAPPTSRLAINLSFNNYLPPIRTIITATASGTYSFTFPVSPEPVYISGNVIHFTAFDMRTYLNFNTPLWRVTLGSGSVSGYAPLYKVPVTVTLQSLDGSFSQALTQTLDQNYFEVDFQHLIQPGDWLALYTPAGLATEFVAPSLTAVHDFARCVLEGRAPPGGQLIAYIPESVGVATRNVRLMPDGRFGVDISDLHPSIGAQGFIQFTDRLGNTTIYRFTIGYLVYFPAVQLEPAIP